MTKPEGYCGYSRPMWMFIQSYEKLREYLYSNATIETLIQFEYSAFEEATVLVCTFAFKNSHVNPKRAAICALWISAVVWKFSATENCLKRLQTMTVDSTMSRTRTTSPKFQAARWRIGQVTAYKMFSKINCFTIILYHQVKM